MNLWLITASPYSSARNEIVCLVEGETKALARGRFSQYLHESGLHPSNYYDAGFELIEVYDGMLRRVDNQLLGD